MDPFIQRLDIEHFERLLQTVTDESVPSASACCSRKSAQRSQPTATNWSG